MEIITEVRHVEAVLTNEDVYVESMLLGFLRARRAFCRRSLSSLLITTLGPDEASDSEGVALRSNLSSCSSRR